MPQIAGYRLAGTETARWPQDEVSFQIPPNTTWATLMTCSDVFAGAVPNYLRPDLDNATTTSIDGQPADHTDGFDCPIAIDPGTMPDDVPSTAGTTTVTMKFRLDPIYDHRNGMIQVGIYYKN